MQQQEQQLSPSGNWWPQPERDSSAPSDVAKKEGKNSPDPALQLYSCPYGKLVGVEVREISPEKGKGLFATRAFRPGDVVFEELPFVATPLELVIEDEEKDYGHRAKLASSIGWSCEECIKAVGLSIWDSADIALRAHPRAHQNHEEATPPFNGDIVRVQIKSQYRGERYSITSIPR